MSTTSLNQHSSLEDLDDVEDKMPEISSKKVCSKNDMMIREFACTFLEKS
jgi:hypothetical protein